MLKHDGATSLSSDVTFVPSPNLPHRCPWERQLAELWLGVHETPRRTLADWVPEAQEDGGAPAGKAGPRAPRSRRAHCAGAGGRGWGLALGAAGVVPGVSAQRRRPAVAELTSSPCAATSAQLGGNGG